MTNRTAPDLVVPRGWLLTFIETSNLHQWQPVTLEGCIISPDAIGHAISAINNEDEE